MHKSGSFSNFGSFLFLELASQEVGTLGLPSKHLNLFLILIPKGVKLLRMIEGSILREKERANHINSKLSSSAPFFFLLAVGFPPSADARGDASADPDRRASISWRVGKLMLISLPNKNATHNFKEESALKSSQSLKNLGEVKFRNRPDRGGHMFCREDLVLGPFHC